MEKLALKLETRQGSGKGEARKLRQSGFIPGIVYGKSANPVPVALSDEKWRQARHDGLRFGRLLELSWGAKKGKPEAALLKAVQFHPVTDKPLHLDFQLIQVGDKIEIDVPLELEGLPIGVKDEGGILEQLLRRVRIKCLPTAIPEKIIVDVAGLDAGETLHVSDLVWAEAEILSDITLAVASVVRPKIEEEPTEEIEEEEAEEEAAPTEPEE